MEVEVRYFATFRKNGVKKEVIPFEKSISVKELLTKVDIQEEDVAILLVNGIKVDSETILKDKDVVSLFPPVGGG